MAAHGYDFVVGGIMNTFDLNRGYEAGLAKLKHFGDQDGWRVGIAGNEIAWSRALGPNWTLPFADVDLLYTASEGYDGTFIPFGNWRRANITQFPPHLLDACNYGLNSPLYVNHDVVKHTGYFALTIAAAAGILLVLVAVALGTVYWRRRRHHAIDANHMLLDNMSDLSDAESAVEPSAIKIIRKEIKLMATERVGGGVIIPKTLALDDLLLKDIVERAHLINKPLAEGSLVKMFSTEREGHDGAVIVEVVGRSEPWIHSSRVRLPYNESSHTAVIQNRGLRHNPAAYACTRTDALIIVVSEERGKISLFHRGTYNLDISKKDFAAKLGAFMPSVGP